MIHLMNWSSLSIIYATSKILAWCRRPFAKGMEAPDQQHVHLW